MSDSVILLARQPICGRDARVFGYELLYRSPVDALRSGTAATADVAVHALLEIGLDRLVGGAVAFVNIPTPVLLQQLHRFLPATRVVLELLEDTEATPDVVAEIREARRLGYRVALDDYVPNARNEPLIPHADVVKIDVRSARPEDIVRLRGNLLRSSTTLLAEKVESVAEVEHYTELGFRLFQGYFFARPQLVTGQRLSQSRAGLLRLLAALNEPDVDFDALEDHIRTDVGLAYKLLRFVNSAVVGPRQPISTLRDALVMLGLERVRVYATMLLLSGADDKPHELVRTALVRARHAELLAMALSLHDARRQFTAGLLSVVDALVDEPMSQVVGQIGVAEDLRLALLRHEGSLGALLEAVIASENADWERMGVPGVDERTRRDVYLDAIAWADATMAALSA